MTRAQMEAARGRVRDTLIRDLIASDVILTRAKIDGMASRLVSAVLGHPDGRVPVPVRRPWRDPQQIPPRRAGARRVR